MSLGDERTGEAVFFFFFFFCTDEKVRYQEIFDSVDIVLFFIRNRAQVIDGATIQLSQQLRGIFGRED